MLVKQRSKPHLQLCEYWFPLGQVGNERTKALIPGAHRLSDQLSREEVINGAPRYMTVRSLPLQEVDNDGCPEFITTIAEYAPEIVVVACTRSVPPTGRELLMRLQ